MVNLDKWEEVDFFDVKLNDKIKCVIEVSPTCTRVVRGSVVWMYSTSDKKEGKIRLQRNGEYDTLRRSRELGRPKGTAIYRRKPKAFKFPTGKGAIIGGEGRNGKVELVHLGHGRWFSLMNTGTYAENLLRDRLTNLCVIFQGVK